MANRTVHSVMHIGWVPDGTGGYRGQMAVRVKPNGRFGAAYMAAIKPFRHLFVYPALMRSIERDWQTNASPSSTGSPGRGGRAPTMSRRSAAACGRPNMNRRSPAMDSPNRSRQLPSDHE
jgi:Protein of unknown function (DUF2867)